MKVIVLHDSLDTVASASYALASALQKIFGLDLTLSGLINKPASDAHRLSPVRHSTSPTPTGPMSRPNYVISDTIGL